MAMTEGQTTFEHLLGSIIILETDARLNLAF